MTPTLDLDELRLASGGHSPGPEMCVMEAVAFISGEPWSDHPTCASAVIGAYLRTWNDSLNDDDRQILKPFIPRLVGTAASDTVETRRSWMACDWLVRTFTPAWLRLAGQGEDATALESLPELTSAALADAAMPVIQRAHESGAGAWAGVRAAAGPAARAAAGAAAGDAAWAATGAAAAWDDAGDAAWAAAGAAARAIAGDASRDAVGETVAALQMSALDLVDRMIEAA